MRDSPKGTTRQTDKYSRITRTASLSSVHLTHSKIPCTQNLEEKPSVVNPSGKKSPLEFAEVILKKSPSRYEVRVYLEHKLKLLNVLKKHIFMMVEQFV